MKLSRHGGTSGRFLRTLSVGALLGAGACYLVMRGPEGRARSPLVEAPVERVVPVPAPVGEDAIARKLREWNLTPEELKRDLATAGKIVREKGRELGSRVADAASDVAIIGKIKTKFALDDHLQALKITVACKDGHVTLTGTVATPELIGRAIVHALDTDGVVDVVSSLKVERKPESV